MGFFSKLFDALAGPTIQKRQHQKILQKNVTYRDPWLTIFEPYFQGHSSRSRNRRWAVGYRDSDGGSTGGMRERGNGAVALVDLQQEEVIHVLDHFARPVAALVSDVGNYIVHDANFGGGLKGDLVAFNVAGQETYRRHFEANIFSIGLSLNGRYAVTQTANAPASDDGNLLELVDLEYGTVLFSTNPMSGWANMYSFDLDECGAIRKLYVELRDLGHFAYSPKGEFLDEKDYLDARLTNGDFATKLMATQELLKSEPTEDGAQRALRIADVALVDGACDRPDWRAIAHRVRGEAFELLGQPTEALMAYDLALESNPKIGVKKRATSLRKKLNGL